MRPAKALSWGGAQRAGLGGAHPEKARYWGANNGVARWLTARFFLPNLTSVERTPFNFCP